MSKTTEQGKLPDFAKFNEQARQKAIADAKLLDASNDLLEACKAALECIPCVRPQRMAPQPNCDCYACKTANQLQSAIAKATGGV